jgi:hypothetical protein
MFGPIPTRQIETTTAPDQLSAGSKGTGVPRPGHRGRPRSLALAPDDADRAVPQGAISIAPATLVGRGLLPSRVTRHTTSPVSVWAVGSHGRRAGETIASAPGIPFKNSGVLGGRPLRTASCGASQARHSDSVATKVDCIIDAAVRHWASPVGAGFLALGSGDHGGGGQARPLWVTVVFCALP